eukprot:TRINITY_DN14522_c0_g1_i3.p1 TRINITY_DN14522_c0_g1~~TRINITY_DN14522_c0_g1_i3.p1  ORF type:complete len:531 (-),score=70.82 TRINITY_DN14522_c0_g1_i3:207-1799(-)
MSRSNIRPRPIDIFRKLPIIRDFKDDAKEIRFEDENGFMRTITMDDQQKQPEEKVEQKKPEKIYVPSIKLIDMPAQSESEKFKRHSAYIKNKKVPEDTVEYDADSEDEAWLDAENAKSKVTNLDRFEIIMDRLEHAARGGNLELGTALKLSFGRKPEPPAVITKIYEYWQTRRNNLDKGVAKALLHRYRILKNHDDPDVNAVFRPREREYVTRKKVRKNDKKSFNRMRELKLNFDRACTVLELMKQREKLKKDRIQVVRAMFEVQCQMLKAQANDPHNRIKIPQAHDKPRSHHSQHHKEKRRRVDYGNPYEQTFNERHRKKPRGMEHSPKDSSFRYAATQSEDALHPKSGGKLKPSKKKTLGTFGKMSSARSTPPVKIIKQFSNKDSAPVDYHSVQHTGCLLAPSAQRDWRCYRYMSRCRVGRGGRIIFDRSHVKDKIPSKIFYGVDYLDWNVISSATLQVHRSGDVCAQVFGGKRDWGDFVWPLAPDRPESGGVESEVMGADAEIANGENQPVPMVIDSGVAPIPVVNA